MNNFEFYSPTCFVFGKETENKAGAYVKRFGGTKVLIHYGGGFWGAWRRLWRRKGLRMWSSAA